MSKPTDDIQFGTDGTALVTEPDTTSKRVGWAPGEEPPAQWVTWLMRAWWRWIAWFDTVLGTDTAQTVLIAGQSGATRETLTVTAAATDKGAIKGTGNGTGAGVTVVGGSGGGRGVEATASNGGIAVHGTATGSLATGVQGTGDRFGVSGTSADSTNNGAGVLGTGGTGASYGGIFIGGTTGSPIRMVPSSQPAGPSQIGDLYMTTGGVLKVCTSAGTPGTWVSVGTQT